MIGIINYEVGNLQSVKNSLNYLNIPNEIVNEPTKIHSFNKIILPGVGSFKAAIGKLDDLGFADEIRKFAETKPILGICLGMQLLFDESYEHGQHNGLGLIAGNVLSFGEKVKDLPLPQIGWNNITKRSDSSILDGVDNDSCFYFVHSFYCKPEEESITAATTDYGITFASVIHKDNIFGCQFHPEKSQKTGLQILENFNKL